MRRAGWPGSHGTAAGAPGAAPEGNGGCGCAVSVPNERYPPSASELHPGAEPQE